MRRYLFALVIAGCLTSTSPGTEARSLPPKVVVTRLSAEEVDQLRKAVPGVELVVADDPERLRAEIADADGFVGVVTPEILEAGERLRWVQVYSAGVDRYRFPELTGSDVVLTNAKIVQGPNVADHAMALLLVLTRGIHVAVRQQADRKWRETRDTLKQEGQRPIELHGKTALVVGLGGIGSAIAERAAGFGMEVIAIDPHPDKPHADHVRSIRLPSALHEALAEADVVFLAVPLTDETRGMIDAKALAVMKPSAYLVNIARGKVVDTDALVAALSSGKLAGAGLDVTEPEPLPPEHPLWGLPNVVITPHMGGTSDAVWARKLELLQDNLGRFSKGQPLRNVVDKTRGY